MELVSARRFFTAIVTASPSRQRNVGAGSEPFTTVAIARRPVMLTGEEPISRSTGCR